MAQADLAYAQCCASGEGAEPRESVPSKETTHCMLQVLVWAAVGEGSQESDEDMFLGVWYRPGVILGCDAVRPLRLRDRAR